MQRFRFGSLHFVALCHGVKQRKLRARGRFGGAFGGFHEPLKTLASDLYCHGVGAVSLLRDVLANRTMALGGLQIVLGMLAVLQMVVSAVGLCLPMHSVSFFTMMVGRVFRMQTSVLHVKVQEKSNDVFNAMNKLNNKAWKSPLEGQRSIQEVAHRFCAQGIHTIFPDLCVGLSNAYLLGMLLLVVFLINMVVEVIAYGQFYAYLVDKPKKSRRRGAFTLLVAGTLPCTSMLLLYALGVLMYLDHMQPVGIVSFTFHPNKGSGVSEGYFLLWLATLMQMGIAVGVNRSRTDHEDIEEQRQDIIEMQRDLFSAANPGLGPGVPTVAAASSWGAHPFAAPLATSWQQQQQQKFVRFQQPAAISMQPVAPTMQAGWAPTPAPYPAGQLGYPVGQLGTSWG